MEHRTVSNAGNVSVIGCIDERLNLSSRKRSDESFVGLLNWNRTDAKRLVETRWHTIIASLAGWITCPLPS